MNNKVVGGAKAVSKSLYCLLITTVCTQHNEHFLVRDIQGERVRGCVWEGEGDDWGKKLKI